MYRHYLDGSISEEEYFKYLHERREADKKASKRFKNLVKEMNQEVYEQVEFPETIKEYLKQHEISDKNYSDIGKIIPVFRIETMLAHYIPKLLKEKDDIIDNLIDLFRNGECDQMCETMTYENESWCNTNCGNPDICPKKECYLEYIKLKLNNKNGESK